MLLEDRLLLGDFHNSVVQKLDMDLIQVIIYMRFPKLLIEGKPKKLEEL